MNNTQKLPFTITSKDVNGNPQPVENFKAEVLNDADLTIEMNADGISGFVVSGDTLGTSQVKFSADAQLGDGEVIIEETHDIIVTNPQAVSLGTTFGTAVPK